MSVLSIHDVDKEVREAVYDDVLMKTHDGQIQRINLEIEEFFKPFEGQMITEQLRLTIKNKLSRFGEHVNCKYCFNCKYDIWMEQMNGAPVLKGFFAYQPHWHPQDNYINITFVLQ